MLRTIGRSRCALLVRNNSHSHSASLGMWFLLRCYSTSAFSEDRRAISFGNSRFGIRWYSGAAKDPAAVAAAVAAATVAMAENSEVADDAATAAGGDKSKLSNKLEEFERMMIEKGEQDKAEQTQQEAAAPLEEASDAAATAKAAAMSTAGTALLADTKVKQIKGPPPNTQRGNFWSYSAQTTFASLGVTPFMCERLREVGINRPSAIQERALPILLDNEDEVIVLGAETGSGKTLAFLLPIFTILLAQPELDPTPFHGKANQSKVKPLFSTWLAVVVAPTSDLVAQIGEVVEKMCQSTPLSYMTGNPERSKPKPRQYPAILVTTPAYLKMNFAENNSTGAHFFVVDEADMLLFADNDNSRSVHNAINMFRYAEKFKDQAGVVTKNAFTDLLATPTATIIFVGATLASPKLVAKIGMTDKMLSKGIRRYHEPDKLEKFLQGARWIKAPLLHYKLPNNKQHFVYIGGKTEEEIFDNKLAKLTAIINQTSLAHARVAAPRAREGGSATGGANQQQQDQSKRYVSYTKILVFCSDPRVAEKVAQTLQEKGIVPSAESAAPLPKGEEDNSTFTQQEKLKRFSHGRCKLLVATDILARGIDFNEVTHVIQWDMARNITQHLHRTGRTARRGRSGESHAFFGKFDQAFIDAITKCGEDSLVDAFRKQKSTDKEKEKEVRGKHKQVQVRSRFKKFDLLPTEKKNTKKKKVRLSATDGKEKHEKEKVRFK